MPNELPPLSLAQRKGLIVATCRALAAQAELGAALDDVRPLIALLRMLTADCTPLPARRGRPAKGPRGWFTLAMVGEATWTKQERRYMARFKRPHGTGSRGPVVGSDHESIRPADAKRLRAMLHHMIDSGDREYAAARAVLQSVAPLDDAECSQQDTISRRLARAYQRFGFAADMPTYRLHREISEALRGGDIEAARALVACLPSNRPVAR